MLELAEIIENAKPEKFHMGSWFGTYVSDVEESSNFDYMDEELISLLEGDNRVFDSISDFSIEKVVKPSSNKINIACNTTACIAGWTIANQYFKENNPDSKDFYESIKGYQMESAAREILDLTKEEAEMLFYCGEESIWYQVQDDYSFVNYDEKYEQLWNISNKDAADVIRKIVSGEYELKYSFERK